MIGNEKVSAADREIVFAFTLVSVADKVLFTAM